MKSAAVGVREMAFKDGSTEMMSELEATDPSSPDTQRHLLNSVRKALGTSGRTALRRVDIWVEHRRITLSGRVRSFYLKQLAQHVTASVDGVLSVDNRLIVVEHADFVGVV